MFAVRAHSRDSPLVYEEVPRPSPGAGEALVRVVAAGITPGELSWTPTWSDRAGHDRTPTIPSHELSGVVEELGHGVTHVAIGDAVMGLIPFDLDGAAAEYAIVRARDVAPKPGSVDHLHAAAIPLSGLAAWQALTEQSSVKAGDRVLIHGGAGGVGCFAVQIAHELGAKVFATASDRDVDFVHDLGADSVIDYRRERFEDAVPNVDIVIDTVGGDVMVRSFEVLRPGGTLVTIAGRPPPVTSRRSDIEVRFFIVEAFRGHLVEMARLAEAGRLRTFVDRVFPLAEAASAYEYALTGHPRGKVILDVVLC
ncbi:MAG: NADP-dependent oxidoreductase [Acidimicrobiia bacterium]